MALSQNHTDKLIQWIVNHPKTILVVTLFLLIGFSIGLKNLSISNDFRVYLSKDNPQLQAFDSFESNYVKSDSATFVVSSKEGDLFNKRALTLIHELTERSWLVQNAYRVTSLSNYQYSQSQNDEITTDDFIHEPAKLTNQSINLLKRNF